jgi:hypothetical protein
MEPKNEAIDIGVGDILTNYDQSYTLIHRDLMVVRAEKDAWMKECLALREKVKELSGGEAK